MQETKVWCLGQEDPLEKGMATCLALASFFPRWTTLMFRKTINSVQSLSRVPTLCDPMDWSMPGFPVHHQLLEITQTHVHRVGDAIKLSHPVVPFSSSLQSFSASGSFPRSQFFASGGRSIGASASASVLAMNIQNWFPLGLTGWISFQSKGLSRVSSNTTVQKHQFFGTHLSLWSNSHIHTHNY